MSYHIIISYHMTVDVCFMLDVVSCSWSGLYCDSFVTCCSKCAFSFVEVAVHRNTARAAIVVYDETN